MRAGRRPIAPERRGGGKLGIRNPLDFLKKIRHKGKKEICQTLIIKNKSTFKLVKYSLRILQGKLDGWMDR
jgi:hypothetical protein